MREEKCHSIALLLPLWFDLRCFECLSRHKNTWEHYECTNVGLIVMFAKLWSLKGLIRLSLTDLADNSLRKKQQIWHLNKILVEKIFSKMKMMRLFNKMLFWKTLRWSKCQPNVFFWRTSLDCSFNFIYNLKYFTQKVKLHKPKDIRAKNCQSAPCKISISFLMTRNANRQIIYGT